MTDLGVKGELHQLSAVHGVVSVGGVFVGHHTEEELKEPKGRGLFSFLCVVLWTESNLDLFAVDFILHIC